MQQVNIIHCKIMIQIIFGIGSFTSMFGYFAYVLSFLAANFSENCPLLNYFHGIEIEADRAGCETGGNVT